MQDQDVIVIGAGPAGLSAGLWCADQGLKALVLERAAEPGGQLRAIHGPISNYPGLDLENGADLRDRMLRQLERTDVRLSLLSEIAGVDLANGKVIPADGPKLYARSIIIATGVRRRKLGIPGEDEFSGRGILDSGMKVRDKVAGKHVVIVGGGDAALENAMILSDEGATITLVHRRGQFTARSEFVERVASLPNVDLLLGATVTRIHGTDKVEGIKVFTEGKTVPVECDHVLVRIGVIPNSELFAGQLETDIGGYISVGPDCLTSIANVFAIGDIAYPHAPTIPTAMGSATIAVKTIAGQINK